jgi:serine/threonine protein phosphatase PrpC
VRFAYGAASDVGRGRSENEDAYLVDEDRHLYAVADGMGGHRAGEVASATAIESLRDAYQAGRPLDEAVEEANAAVFAKASAHLEMRGMGTTLTAVALLDDHIALLGHVGDSRAYLMRAGDVTRVTEDHSLVEQLVREGRLSPEDAASHPQKAIITRALGIDPEIEVDTYRIDLRPGDRLLLCSDGLTNMVNDDGIAGVLSRQADPQRAAETLIDMANRAGGDDNITVVVVDALGDGPPEEKAASAALGSQAHEEPTGEWAPLDESEDGSAGATPATEAAEAVAAEPEAETGEPPATEGRRRRRAVRLLAWLLPVVLVFGVALGAMGWYARRTFYVGLGGERVTLYRGVPGGLLGWDPTVEKRSDLRAADLTDSERADLEDGHRFASRAEAVAFLERLEADRAPTLRVEPAPEPGPPVDPGPIQDPDPLTGGGR